MLAYAAQSVDDEAIIALDLVIAPRRDDCLSGPLVQPFAQRLAIVTLSATSSADGGRAAMEVLATLQSWTFPGVGIRT